MVQGFLSVSLCLGSDGINQELLTENTFCEYLLYAIGEIALVLIVILIALQMNNRNKKMKWPKFSSFSCVLKSIPVLDHINPFSSSDFSRIA